MLRTMLTAAAVAAALAAAGQAAAADGPMLYAVRCAGCHTLTAASGPAGPSLNGLMRRGVAGAADYAYSPGLKAKGGKWTAATLDAYLKSPMAFSAGGKMFVAVTADADRAALVAYLTGLK